MDSIAASVRAFMAKHAPSRDEVQNSVWLRPFGHRIRQSDLWRFTRRSVPRGVAIGLFVGIFLMVPGLQIVGAALVCMALRGNVAIAAAMTFLSNPATTPFFLVAALNMGNRLGFHADLTTFKILATTHASIGRWLAWLFSDAAPAMVVGWRWWVGRKWNQRRIAERNSA